MEPTAGVGILTLSAATVKVAPLGLGDSKYIYLFIK